MRKLLLSVCLCLSFGTQAQIIIDQQDLPKVGTHYVSKTNQSDATTVSAGTTGKDQMWDFSSLSAQGTDTTKYLLPSSTPFYSNYPTATQVKYSIVDEGDMYYYFNSNATSIEIIGAGLVSSQFPGSPPIPLKVSTPLTYIKIPFTYGYVNTSETVFTGKVSASSIGINFPFIDSAKIEIRLQKTDTVNGSGTVKTPQNSYDALRITTYTTTSMNYFTKQFGFWQPADASIPPTSSTIVEKAWWAKNIGTEVFKIEYEDNLGTKPLRVSWFDEPGKLGLSRVENSRYSLVMQPNPAYRNVTVTPSLQYEYSITISSSQGKVVYHESFLNGPHTIDTYAFQPGMYVAVLKSEKGLSASKKLIIQ